MHAKHERNPRLSVRFPVLILAAGSGRRLGKIKPLLSWQGMSLLERAILQARAVAESVSVVVGASGALIRYRTRIRPSRWVDNPDWREGMASSLRSGLSSLPADAHGVLVMLVDQPLIPVSHYHLLSQGMAARPDSAMATRYAMGGAGGVPAYLPRSLWPAIRLLRGDQGARSLLSDARLLDCFAGASDIDTPAEFERFRVEQTGLKVTF